MPQNRFLLLSYPRTTSNLLLKILAIDRQPKFSTGSWDGGYFFIPVSKTIKNLGLEGRNLDSWTEDQCKAVQSTAKECFEALTKCVEAAEAQGHDVFIKEHTVFLTEPVTWSRFWFGKDSTETKPWRVGVGSSGGCSLNPTWLPDEMLLQWRPIFLIRHPALAFPSYYRTIVKSYGKEAADRNNFAAFITTVEWSRSLCDFYTAHSKEIGADWPVIVDADDILSSPEIVLQLCDRMGMDRKQLQFSWEQSHTDDEHRYIMRSTLYESNGIIASKTSNGIDLVEEAAKWREEFGEDAGRHIEKMVEDAMPDYDCLRERRMRLSSERG